MHGFAEGQPTAVVMLDKERTIGHSFGAINRVREKLGGTDMDPTSDADITQKIPVWIWACLPEADRKELSPERVADLIHRGNQQSVIDAFVQLVKESAADEPANPTVAGADTPPAMVAVA
jgi:hypothetical protein